jgi:hypothetical protein
MKEVEKKDVPEISGGQSSAVSPLPYLPEPHPMSFPPNPGGPIVIGPIGPIGPTDSVDPLGDAINKNQL